MKRWLMLLLIVPALAACGGPSTAEDAKSVCGVGNVKKVNDIDNKFECFQDPNDDGINP